MNIFHLLDGFLQRFGVIPVNQNFNHNIMNTSLDLISFIKRAQIMNLLREEKN